MFFYYLILSCAPDRCFAALRDVAKVKSLQKINEMATAEGLGYDHYKVRAKLAIIEKQFKLAEQIYLEQVSPWLNY